MKTALRRPRYSKMALAFLQVLQKSYPFLCHFVTYNREYYECLYRLKRRIQVGRLPVQGTWLGSVNQPVIEGPTGQTSNNLVISSRW